MRVNSSPILEKGSMDVNESPWAINSTPCTLKSRLSHQEKWDDHRCTPSTPRTATLPFQTNNTKIFLLLSPSQKHEQRPQ